jgi:FKBP-type peptidyl-prolyl cis-trans isomerase FkpA
MLNEAYSEIQAKKTEENKQNETEFLAQNSIKEGIFTTESGLQYEIIMEGRGPKPSPEDVVRVHYEGTLLDGTVFDSSYSRGEPVEFALSGVIPGWSEGLQLMNEGASYRLFIPSELGYGPWGAGQTIPPYATLTFKVDLISIVK